MTEQFPELEYQRENGQFYYFDSAATTLKPASVIRAISEHYAKDNANTRRGFYPLAAKADEICEITREKVRDFIGAKYITECIFTHGATESLNVLAHSITKSFLKSGDEVIVSQLEHHSSLLPWRALEKEGKIKLKILPCSLETGKIQAEELESLITDKSRVFVLTPESNVIGKTKNFDNLLKLAKNHNLITVADCAQIVAHRKLDLEKSEIDFAAFSGHKMYAEMGIGVLYGRQELLEQMHPSLYGGEMVEDVALDGQIQLAELPYRFEAGTINLGGIVSLGAAIDFMQSCDFNKIHKLETLLKEKLTKIPELEIIGQPEGAILSFQIKDVHPHDVAQILASDGICVRAGYHCAQPLLEELGPVTRISLGIYNTEEDIEYLAANLATIRKRMRYE
jgi:cysteine desulfurase/selenocysteine lyase